MLCGCRECRWLGGNAPEDHGSGLLNGFQTFAAFLVLDTAGIVREAIFRQLAEEGRNPYHVRLVSPEET